MTEIERPERIAYRNPVKRLGWAQVSNEIGEVTPRVRERLVQLLDEYPDLVRWEQAFDAVVSSGVRRLDYLTACLESDGKPRWSRPR